MILTRAETLETLAEWIETYGPGPGGDLATAAIYRQQAAAIRARLKGPRLVCVNGERVAL